MRISSLSALVSSVSAVFRDDVSFVDWKLTFIGKPLQVAEFEDRSAIISDTNSLTCIDAKGTTAWRHTLLPAQIASGSAMVDDVIVVGGDTLSGFDARRGILLWKKPVEAKSVYTYNGNVVVNDHFIVNVTNGDVQEETTVKGGGPLKPAGNSFQSSNGTLSWNNFGLLQYETSDGNVTFTRDEGLAHIKQASFVPLPPESDERSIAVLRSSQKPVVEAMIDRVTAHLLQLKSLCSFIMKKGPAMLVLPEQVKPQFGFDQTSAVLSEQGSVYGSNITNSGSISWVYHDSDAIRLEPSPHSSYEFLVISRDGNTYEVSAEGDILRIFDGTAEEVPADFVEINGNTIHSTLFDWTIELPGDLVVGHASRDPRESSGSVVVSAPSGDVLYKYSQPNAAVYASYGADTHVSELTSIDTVTGRILSTHAHTEPIVINKDWPFEIAFGEHWFVYTYFGLDASQSMKISVAESYESEELNTRVSTPEVNLWNDQSTPYVKLHTWVSPSKDQPVYGLATSISPFGAASRDIIFGLEHQVVSIPKSLLNAINPAPEVYVLPSGHLSHVYGIERASQSVVGPTNSEFTYLLAAIGENSDLLVTRVAPSGEVDRLSSEFPKLKLLMFVGAIAFVVVTLSPLARNKVLGLQWR